MIIVVVVEKVRGSKELHTELKLNLSWAVMPTEVVSGNLVWPLL